MSVSFSVYRRHCTHSIPQWGTRRDMAMIFDVMYFQPKRCWMQLLRVMRIHGTRRAETQMTQLMQFVMDVWMPMIKVCVYYCILICTNNWGWLVGWVENLSVGGLSNQNRWGFFVNVSCFVDLHTKGSKVCQGLPNTLPGPWETTPPPSSSSSRHCRGDTITISWICDNADLG